MRSIFEILSKHVEPSIKRQLVESLVKKGLSKIEIAKCLDVSPSLITRYLRKERGLHDFTVFKDVSEKVDQLANRIVRGELREATSIYYELLRIVLYSLSRRYVCGIHHALDKKINPLKCSICPDLFVKDYSNPLPNID